MTFTRGFTDPDSAITGYDWDFDGNGTVDRTTTTPTTDFAYADAGRLHRDGRGEGLPRRRRFGASTQVTVGPRRGRPARASRAAGHPAATRRHARAAAVADVPSRGTGARSARRAAAVALHG